MRAGHVAGRGLGKGFKVTGLDPCRYSAAVIALFFLYALLCILRRPGLPSSGRLLFGRRVGIAWVSSERKSFVVNDAV